MSKLFGGSKNKGPSAAELREQARQDYELAMKSQMSKEDAEGWRQEIQADQLATAMPIFQALIDTGMSMGENNPMFQKLGGEVTERPSLMDLIGSQMQQGAGQQQAQQQSQQQSQQQAQQQAAQQAAMGQQGGMGMNQQAQVNQQAQMGQQGQMGQTQDQQQQGGMSMNASVPSMADINSMLKQFNINI
jgi:hypothetical protein